ncbi:glycosyltransferase involved in cell wall biosynthesis [Anaerotaenia torta]|uniref:GtrA family protein n=1 Tax=Anaerotaenia torta TaxID=433293 RepID=UPI003D24950D
MLKKQMRIVLIPAYQPENSLLDLVREVNTSGFLSIVVDDGSGSQYIELFEKISELTVVLRHPQNCGKGRAIKTGLQYIFETIADEYTVVTMDADGQHRVEDAARICQVSERHPGALVLGSRKLKDHVPLRSRFGNTVTRYVFRLSTGQKVYDTQTGLRAFSASLIPAMLEIAGERYEYEMNVLLEFTCKKIPIEEIEIATIYMDNNAGSHFDILKDSFRIYKEIFKFSASSFLSFIVDYSIYSLMSVLTGGLGASVSLTMSNIIARILSASMNYSLNRKWVFKSKTNAAKSALQYFALAIVILAANTFALSILVEQIWMNRYRAKLLIELCFFALSWFVQHFVIFRKKERK